MPVQGFPAAQRKTPKTVNEAKEVKLVLVSFNDGDGIQKTTLAVVGDSTVHMLDGRGLGLSREPTGQGQAPEWLCKALMEKLSKKKGVKK